MSFFHLKSIVALFFFAAGVTALVSMLTLMGRSETRLRARTLKTTHRVAGYVFAGLAVVLAVLGLSYLAIAGDSLPLRGVIHWTLALLLLVALALKIAIARSYRKFLPFVPVFGLTVFALAFVVVAVSAGFFAVTGGRRVAAGGAVAPRGTPAPEELLRDGDVDLGQAVFARNCSGCHHADRPDPKVGPGLGGLSDRGRLASSGKPVSRESLREQIVAPAGTMPSFEGRLPENELTDLLAYLETL